MALVRRLVRRRTRKPSPAGRPPRSRAYRLLADAPDGSLSLRDVRAAGVAADAVRALVRGRDRRVARTRRGLVRRRHPRPMVRV